MPKISTPKSARHIDVKPYTTSSPTSSDIDPPFSQHAGDNDKPTKPTSTSKTKSPPWTNAERLILFRIAITKGASAKNFEGVLPGRTAHLCYCQWYKNIVPSIEKLFGDGSSRS